MGGAWEFCTMIWADESMPRDSPEVVRTATTTGEYGASHADEGCTKGACIAGMVLQQFCP